VSKSYYEESLLDNFFCSSYVQFSTIVLVVIREPTGWLFAEKKIAAKTGKKTRFSNFLVK
jgi:hypothetical protein